MKKGIIQIFFSNIIFLLFSVLNNFILPKYLSIDAYADFKTYILYSNYAGLLSFGFIEGMFLKYGGKILQQAKEDHCGSAIRTFYFLQTFIVIFVFVLGVSLQNIMIVLFGLNAFSANIVNFYKNFSTATAEYKIYSISTCIEKAIIFAANAVFIFLFRCNNYIVYSFIIIAVLIIEIIYFTIMFEKQLPGIHKGRLNIPMMKEITTLGIILLLGNSVSALFTGIDQWFIKLFMDKSSFASYAFAVSMERVIIIFITPITTVLYNYFCQEKAGEHNDFLKHTLLIWSFFILAMTYPLRWIVQTFIENYSDSVEIIFILFCGQAINCVINGIYVNKYKAEKRQNHFLKQMILITLLSIALNGLMYWLFHSMIGIATATLITKYIWLLWCEYDSKFYRYSFWENIVIILLIFCFIASSQIHNSILGFCVYFSILAITVLLTMKETCFRLIREVKGYLKTNRKDL